MRHDDPRHGKSAVRCPCMHACIQKEGSPPVGFLAVPHSRPVCSNLARICLHRTTVCMRGQQRRL
eukprot:365744-Chlamydomonas_euryale.AAC.17